MRRLLICLLVALLTGGCGDAGDPRPAPPQVPLASDDLRSLPSAAVGAATGGWEVTVYYTAVQEYHHGPDVTVTGCPTLDCADGRTELGSFPADFVKAVKDEGTGRLTDGRYLNWSYDIGYWLDTATRDSYGRPLEPFVSAAADPGVLRAGTRFTIADCGALSDGGGTPPEPVCAALRAANWVITDEFTPGLGGSRHIDAYIGPETGPGFTDSDWYVTLTGATLQPN